MDEISEGLMMAFATPGSEVGSSSSCSVSSLLKAYVDTKLILDINLEASAAAVSAGTVSRWSTS
jgi:hypothetical protein